MKPCEGHKPFSYTCAHASNVSAGSTYLRKVNFVYGTWYFTINFGRLARIEFPL